MLFCVFLAVLGAAVVTGHDGPLTAPSGVSFVGIYIGYNIVEGNPEGDGKKTWVHRSWPVGFKKDLQPNLQNQRIDW